MSITRKLSLLFVGLILAYSWMAGLSYYKTAKEYAIEESIRSCDQTVHCVADFSLSERLLEMEQVVDYWATSPALMKSTHTVKDRWTVRTIPAPFHDIATKWNGYMISNRSVSGLYLGIQANGSLIGFPADATIPASYDAREREWYQAAVRNPGKTVWTSPYEDVGKYRNLMLSVSRAVVEDGRLIGVVGMDIHLHQLSGLLKSLYAGQDGSLILLNGQGTIYAHPDSAQLNRSMADTPWIGAVLKQASGSGRYSEGGRDYVYAYRTLPKTGWKLIATKPLNLTPVFGDIRNQIMMHTLAAGLCAILAAVLLTKTLFKPLRRLVDTIDAVSEGDWNARMPVRSNDEAGVLASAFNRMLDTLHGLERERDEHLKTLRQRAVEAKVKNEEIQELNRITEAMNAELKLMFRQTRHGYVETVRALANAIEASDHYTRGHCERVSSYGHRLGQRAGLEIQQLSDLDFAGILHDIGKIGIPNEILHKPGRLTDAEFRTIQRHPAVGAEILDNIEFLARSREILLQHHERPDGKGYPAGLTGEEQCIEARILAIADSYDAMTSSRPYREIPMSTDAALEELMRGKGTQFDGPLTDLFAGMIREDAERAVPSHDEKTG